MKTLIFCVSLLISSLSFAQMGSEGGGGIPDYPEFIKITVNKTMVNNPEADSAKLTLLALIGRSISIGQIIGYRAKIESGKIVFCVDLGKNRDANSIFLRSIDLASFDRLNVETPLLITETLEKSCI